ncbi:ASCH domain-containing protein [Cellulomonas soli]|uniref:ASCH domain-containing protein n=1 Tax=Cellulomonas soli TaxID=931535 RepID=UPI003F83986C
MSTEDQDQRIAQFWDAARGHLGLGSLDVVVGMQAEDAVAPPTWSFGDNAALADELLGLVLAGRKTGTATSMVELEDAGEPVPRVGDLSIVLDGDGEPRALLRTTQVEVAPFGEVGADFAFAEGEDDRSLASWRTEHERYWRRVLGDDRFSTDLLVVQERFEVVYP